MPIISAPRGSPCEPIWPVARLPEPNRGGRSAAHHDPGPNRDPHRGAGAGDHRPGTAHRRARAGGSRQCDGTRRCHHNRRAHAHDKARSLCGGRRHRARAARHDVKTSIVPLDQVPRALAARDVRGLVELVADASTDRLLGGQTLAPEGADSVQTLALALRFGMTTQALGATISPYLTTVKGLKLAAPSFGKDVAKLSCCAGRAWRCCRLFEDLAACHRSTSRRNRRPSGVVERPARQRACRGRGVPVPTTRPPGNPGSEPEHRFRRVAVCRGLIGRLQPVGAASFLQRASVTRFHAATISSHMRGVGPGNADAEPVCRAAGW